jgi:TatD DNase family protein
MQLIDAHCHLDFPDFDNDRDMLIAEAGSAGISDIVVPGTQQTTWDRVNDICKQHRACHPCYGLHPYWCQQHRDDDIAELERYLSQHGAIAVGECGLDFRPQQAPRDRQLYFFEAQLDIAYRHALPVVIHAVKATDQIYQSLKAFPGLTGMIHSYSGSLEQAEMLVADGFYISLGAAVTYPQAKKVRRVARELPLDYLLLETDAPDQPGIKHQKQRNQPAWLVDTLSVISELRNEPVANIADQTTINAKRLFSL